MTFSISASVQIGSAQRGLSISRGSSFSLTNKALLDNAVTHCRIQPLVLFWFGALNCLSPYLNASCSQTDGSIPIKAAIRDTVPETDREVFTRL